MLKSSYPRSCCKEAGPLGGAGREDGALVDGISPLTEGLWRGSVRTQPEVSMKHTP
jgi:hypothetical protein